MSDNSPLAPPVSMTRPQFVMPPGGITGTTYEFFGPTVINAPLAAGNQVIGHDVGADEQQYLFQVASVYTYWRNQYILGPASAQGSPFIPTDTAALFQQQVSARPGAPAAARQLQRRPIALPDAIRDFWRVLLLGKPGGGKTSYLQYMALQCTRADTTPIPGLLPVVVDLSMYTTTGPFLDFVRGFLRTPPNPQPPEPPVHVQSPWMAGALETYLQNGRVLLMLDGLNELPALPLPAAAARLAQLQAFFHQYTQIRTIVTCRMLDYTTELDGLDFHTVLLDPWSVDQIADYLQKRQAGSLLARLRAGDPLLLSLGQVPFLLYMLTELIANYPPPPADSAAPEFLTSQSGLFKQFVEMLLNWATLKDQENALFFPRPVIIAALAQLAAAMGQAGYRGTSVPHDWAGAHLASDPLALFQGLPPPEGLQGDPRDHLLDFSCAATILDTPATRDTVRFWHLTHQDYFNALAAGQPGAILGPLTPATDDVTSLAAAMAPQPDAAIAGILQQNDPRAAIVAAKALLSAGGG